MRGVLRTLLLAYTVAEQCGLVEMGEGYSYPSAYTDRSSFELPPDIDRDGVVGVLDVLLVIIHWGPNECFAEIEGDDGTAWPEYRDEHGRLPFAMTDIDRSHATDVGDLNSVSTYALTGSECGIGTLGTFTWIGVPVGDLYFLIVGTDGAAAESSWGLASSGTERNGLGNSAQCGVTLKDPTGSCP